MSITPQAEHATSSSESQTELRGQLDALLHHAAFVPLDDLGWLRVTGTDRVRWLNGMVTNSIQSLAPGQGCFNFLLNAQGRIQGTATAFALDDVILLETDRLQLPTLTATLDRFIIMDDVELTDATGTGNLQAGLAVIGSQAAALLVEIGLPSPESGTLAIVSAPWQSDELLLIAAHSPLLPRFELWSTPQAIASLTAALVAAGAAPSTNEAVECLRLLEGTPRYGTDIRNTEGARDLPQETAQTRALHFAKGCYLGQEIVERIRSRGNVHRTFTGFRLEGILPAPGTSLAAAGKAVGEITSAVTLPFATGTLHLALGYIRREILERGEPLSYSGGEAHPIALPFTTF